MIRYDNGIAPTSTAPRWPTWLALTLLLAVPWWIGVLWLLGVL